MNFWHVLTLILVAAKLAGFFPHSWWWVMAPALTGAFIGFFFMLCSMVIAALVGGKR